MRTPTLTSIFALGFAAALALGSTAVRAEPGDGPGMGPGRAGPPFGGPGMMMAQETGSQPASSSETDKAQDRHARAAEHAGHRDRDRDRRGIHWVSRRERLFDTNGDGKLSAAEITGEIKRLVAGADVNGDGSLSVDEFRRRGAWFIGLRTMTIFDMLDTNGDGELSVAEMTGPSERWLKRYDTNKDGVLDANELAKAWGAGRHRDRAREGRHAHRGEMRGRENDHDRMAGRDGRRHRDHGENRWVSRRERLLDINHDGKLSAAEITGEIKRLMLAADVNGDGKLSADEFRRRGDWFIALRTMTLFDMLDANGDGRLSAAELTGPSERWFKRYDTNKDGVLDAEELAKAWGSGRDGRHRR